jgi:hypothetical protein
VDTEGGIAARLAELESRVAALEGEKAAPGGGLDRDAFWALSGLQERSKAPNGAVLFTGGVNLPSGEYYHWQQSKSTDDLLGMDWTESSNAFAALGHPVRLLLLGRILGGMRTVAELQELDEVGTTGQLYHHLKQLVAANWLQTAGRGRYAVPGHRVVPLLVLLAATHPEVG